MNEELKEQINADMKSFTDKVIDKYLFSESNYHPESAKCIMKYLISGFMSTFLLDLSIAGEEKEASKDLENWIRVMRDIIRSEELK